MKSKEVAWGGIIMALTVILIVLSGVIESSSLFILALASFATGIVERKFSLKTGIAFTIGAAFIGFFVAPQKLYVFTYLGFSIYVVLAEYFREKNIYGVKSFVIKGVLYHILLIIAVALVNYFIGFDVFLENSFINNISKIQILYYLVLFVFAEALWILFDKAYIFFQERYGLLFIEK